MNSQKGNLKGKSQKKKALYSEEFQAMLDRLEEEDYEDRSGDVCMMRKNRLCIDQVKALEKHFEEENKLQPERKVKIAEEIGLEPRQVAVWFQNRRARWKTKHLEREYDNLRANYDSLKHDYGSLQQEKQALLSQLKDLKAKIEAKTLEISTTNLPIIPATLNSSDVSVPLSISSSISSSFSTFDPLFPMASSSTMDNGFQLCKAYQNQLMSELGMFNSEESCNFFSVDQAPTLHWYHGDQFNY